MEGPSQHTLGYGVCMGQFKGGKLSGPVQRHGAGPHQAKPQALLTV